MLEFRRASTESLWDSIACNAKRAQEHMNWPELLDNIAVLHALVSERIEHWQREMRVEQCIERHRSLSPEARGGDEEALLREITPVSTDPDGLSP